MLHICLSLLFLGCNGLFGVLQHYDFKLKLSVSIHHLVSLSLELLQLDSILFDHSLFDEFVLLVQLKSLLFVDRQSLQQVLNFFCDRHHVVRVKELVLEKKLLLVLRDRL